MNLKLFRGATDIGSLAFAAGYTNSSVDVYLGSIGTSVLDSPATTSATTYKTQFANQTAAASVQVQTLSAQSTIVLLEISA